jgi:hypothetical protein
MSFAIITHLYLFSFDVYYFLLKFHVLIVSPLKYILCIDLYNEEIYIQDFCDVVDEDYDDDDDDDLYDELLSGEQLPLIGS